MNSEVSPNVHEASQPKEVEQLEKDYQEAVKDALANGMDDIRLKFENTVKENSCAIVSMKTRTLEKLLMGEPYKSYYEKHNASVEIEEKELWERLRKATDILLFGEKHGKQIRYALLSLDGLGLSAYGNCHCYICFDDDMPKKVSVYKINAFAYLKEGKFKPFEPGYRATWLQRHKLAVAKLVDRLQAATLEGFPMILCHDTGEKEDDCIEVHIYGQFELRAILAVKLTRTKDVSKHLQEDVNRENTHLNTIVDRLMGKETQELIGRNIQCQII